MDGVTLGHRVGPFTGRLDTDLLDRYAAAIGGPSPAAVVTQIWQAQTASRAALVPPSMQQGVHGEHDIRLHRPVEPGEALRIWVEGHGARPAGRNAVVTLRYTMLDADDAVVCEQWWTTVYLGTSCDPVGAAPPDHGFPADATPCGTYAVEVDAEMARRYAGVSGDWSAHHFDAEAAKRSGFDRPFLHGLCTMALCGRAVAQVLADGDATRVSRLAVRFASPVFLGEALQIGLYDGGPLGYAFEARSRGVTVISHGRAEVR